MTKKVGVLLSAVLLGLALAGCGKASVSVQDHSVAPSGMAAVIKGKTNQGTVRYTINGGSTKTTKSQSEGYSLTIPAKPYKQTVKVSVKNGNTETVTVAKRKTIMTYTKFQTAYNQTLAGEALSKSNQTKATNLQDQAAALKKQSASIQAQVKTAKAKLAKGDTSATATLQDLATKGEALKTQAAKLKATQASLAPALKKAQASVKNDTLPATAKNGIHTIKTTKHYKVRTNVYNGKLMGATLIVPISALKNDTQAKKFAMTFSVLATGVGANAKHVLKTFSNNSNKKNSSQTTTETIHSNGVTFSLGYSTSTLYIYVTK
ncbi:hypothetical protein AYR62_11590 [Secundilactobacillus paracollinoides]|uniref:PspA/IM30 family protein n=1 Tax=Secundilactobacillus paracollinoides TaxID=240427 RepID=UPI00081A698D|nr:hypothetical protein [Secundilactobacillus paracollinoides]ANZ64653.1 hypothetical protein AYR62_11590 [Secundilactobacillus paracollinoides]